MTSTPHLTAENIFSAYEDLLGLTWLGGRSGRHRPLEQINAKFPGLALVGHLNLIHPNRVQILGANELAHIDGRGPEDRHDILNTLFSSQYCSAIIIAEHGAYIEDTESTHLHKIPQCLWVSASC